MNIFNGIEYIKNFFTAPKLSEGLSPFADEDIYLLSCMASETCFLNAKDGKNYFYYVLHEKGNMDVARFLFARNGLKASVHKSEYFYTPKSVLRILNKDFAGKTEQKKFVRSIKVNYYNGENINNRILQVRTEMKQKSK